MGDLTTLELRGSAGPVAPLQRWALWLASLTRWHRHLAALLLGALAAASLPPVDMTPVLLISFPGLVWLTDGNTGYRSAFALGWSFGFGFFIAGLYWIAAALFVHIAQFWWLVPFAVAGVPAGLAIFAGTALLVSHALCRALRLGGTGRVLALVFCWCGAEWLRGHILTGFPWNLMGYAWSGAFPGGIAMLQFASLAGIYGLSLLTVLAVSLPARLGDFSGRRALALFAAGLLIALPAGWGAYRLANGHPGDVAGVNLRLVQPSIPQTMKQDPSALLANFRRLFALSTSPASATPTAIIWPEDAAPPFLDRDGGARQALAQATPQNGYIITGTTRTDPAPEAPTHVWNSLVAVDHEGNIRASYDKFHLVPFGEYVPLRGFLPMQKITPGAIDFSAGPGPRTIALPGLPPFSPLICYEAIFPGAVVDPAHRPDWLLNITDDAWYGFTSGPFQHLAIARLRAIEEGLPLARAGDNGVSAMFDPYGRVTARLALNDVGVLDVPLPQPLPPTLYSRVGDIPFFAAMLFVAAGLFWSRLSARQLGRKA
ncbi:MAG TPA: apolipoprotein N-acyltransferase [Stellaceae bacterium]|nr:apolipoprotein N-acyltransferase [Stellaceae bacterium]